MKTNYGYLFLVRTYIEDELNTNSDIKIELDAFCQLQCSKYVDLSTNFIKLFSSYDAIINNTDLTDEMISSDSMALSGMDKRARINTELYGPCLVFTGEYELDRDSLTTLLYHKYEEGTLKTFIDESKISK